MATAASEQERTAAIELVREHGLAEAARLTGRSKGTLSGWAKAAGVTLDVPERTKKAIEARRVSLEQRRQELAAGLLDDVDRLRGQLFSSCQSTHWDKDGEFHTAKLAEPTFSDKKAVVTSVAILVDKVQLLTGGATARTEMVAVDQLDAEIARLRAEMDRADV